MKVHAVFAGCARDCAPYLPGVLANMEAVSQQFCEKAAFVFVENDSKDATGDLLRQWCAGRENTHVFSYPPDTIAHFPRTVRLAMARNRYLDALALFQDYEYLLVFDLDAVNATPLPLSALEHALSFLASSPDIVAVFANAKGFYYDLWALRHAVCPGDIWEELAVYRSAHPTVAEDMAKQVVLGKKVFSIAANTPPVAVDSAFGGLGIYKIAPIQKSGARYVGHRITSHNQVERAWQCCEHVAFHRDLRQAGGRLFIFPELINGEYPEPYFLQASPCLSFDPAVLETVSGNSTGTTHSTPKEPCRICGGQGRKVFNKRLCDKYDAAYFQCESCGCLFSEKPYWLEEAFAQPEARFDTTQMLRALDNAAFLDTLITLNWKNDLLVDYGCGEGLCVRLLRDVGYNAWGYDKYKESAVCTGFQLDALCRCSLVNCGNVTESFANPMEKFEKIFEQGPIITLVKAPCVNERISKKWLSSIPEHGQHVFYWSPDSIKYVAKAFDKTLLFFPGFFAFVSKDPSLAARVKINPLLWRPAHEIRARFFQKLSQVEYAQAHLDLGRLWERHYLGGR